MMLPLSGTVAKGPNIVLALWYVAKLYCHLVFLQSEETYQARNITNQIVTTDLCKL